MKTKRGERPGHLRPILPAIWVLALAFMLSWPAAQAAPTWQSQTTLTVNAANITLNNPVGTVQNDLLLATISTRGGTVAAPAGWTQVRQQTQGTETLAVFWLRYNANTAANHQFTWPAGARAAGAILRYTGVDGLQAIDASAIAVGTSTNATAPTITTTVADTTVVRIAGIGAGNAPTAPANSTPPGLPITSRVSIVASGSGDDAGLGVADAAQPSAGGTGTAAFTSSNASWVAVTVALRPFTSTLCANPPSSGTTTLPAGVYNTYYPGTLTAAAGAVSIALGTSRGAATPIAAGDLLLVIQMQDATINTSNDERYGDGTGTAGNTTGNGSGATNYNNAGKYEFVVAKSAVVGGAVQIEGKGTGGGLINTYTDANAANTQGQRRFQVVRVPQYFDATVTGAVTAAAWNGTSGGIVAMDVANTLTFSGGSINVSAQGFRGGGGQQLLGGGTGTNTDYVTLRTVNTNGNKAEGVAGSPRNMYDGAGATTTGGGGYPTGGATTGDRARGAPGNAGGGGTDDNPANNDENSGGGGGGNGGAGGLGGYCWSNASCPGRGIGGAVFPAGAGTLALGGGGGSGSRNNSDTITNASSGGRGGGIILIRANSFTGSGTLSANGGVGVTPANDGGGGGGAGGSVLVFARTGTLTGLTITANGGDGTNAAIGGAAHGPGGGGGGGVIYLSSAAGSTSAAGGAGGSTVTLGNNYGAASGAGGATNTTLTEAGIPGVSSGATCEATLASVAGFGATVEGGRVVLTWETAFELGTAGFHVERLDPILGDYERVNAELLPALITSPQGGRYSYVDADAWPGQTYRYRLVEQEVWGSARTHGPYTVTPTEPVGQRALSGVQATSQGTETVQGHDDPERGYKAVSHGKDANRRNRKVARTFQSAAVHQVARTAVLGASLSSNALQIPVRADGPFYASAADLAKVLGRTEAAVVRWIGTAQVRLTTGGRGVAWMPASNNAGIYFYGEPIDSLYTLDNVYRVRVGQTGVQMKGSPTWETAPKPVAAGTFQDTVTVEEDRFAATVVSTDPGTDYWYWDGFIGDFPGWSAKSFSIDLPNVAGDGVLSVFLKGAGSSAHPVSVSVNGHPLGEGTWDGLSDYELRLPVAATQLKSGGNLVEVRALGGTENMFYLDRIAVQYRRLARAVGDRLTLKAEVAGPLAADGFSSGNVRVFDITNPKTPRHLTAVTVAPGAVGQGITFNAKAGGRYLAWTDAAITTAVPVAMTVADLQRSPNRVDYLVIAPPALRDAAQELAAYRETTGLSSLVVGTDEIYDSFNWGVVSPTALREFLRQVAGPWGLRYVVLAGMGSLDYRDLGGLGEPQAPTLMTSTPNGLFGCDNCLVDFDGDGAPDIPLGRVPAATPADLQSYLAKVKAYEAAAGPLDRAGAILLADKPDPAAGDFPTASDQVAALLPSGMPVTRIYLDQVNIDAARSLLFGGMNQGTGWVNYLGHGGSNGFSSEGLLTVDDLGALRSTGRLPVISAMTCAANRFEIPGYAPLGARLALDPDGGAIAVWSPSGLSLNGPAVDLNRSLFDAVFQGWAPTLGDAVQHALQDNTRRVAMPTYMLRIYSLIGDPALTLTP